MLDLGINSHPTNRFVIWLLAVRKPKNFFDAHTYCILARSSSLRSYWKHDLTFAGKQLTPLPCYYSIWFLFPKGGIKVTAETLNQTAHLLIHVMKSDNFEARDYLNKLTSYSGQRTTRRGLWMPSYADPRVFTTTNKAVYQWDTLRA
jgi:hypothetical protein